MPYSLLLCAVCLSGAATSVAEPLAVVELTPYVGKLHTIPLRLGESVRPYLFDTAGGLTCVTPEVAEEVGCEPWGHASGFRLSGERVAFEWCGDMTLAAGEIPLTVEISVFDLTPLLGEAPALAGLASVHTFAERPFTVDLNRGQLVLESDASLAERTADMARLSARFANQAGGASVDPFVEVQAATGTLWLELDSGNVGRTILAPHAVDQLGLTSREDQVVALDVVGLGPVPLEVRVLEGCIYDGVLGVELFEGRAFTFDVGAGEIWASP